MMLCTFVLLHIVHELTPPLTVFEFVDVCLRPFLDNSVTPSSSPYPAAVLVCCCAGVLLCCCAGVLLCWCAAVLLCCCAAVLLCCCAAVL